MSRDASCHCGNLKVITKGEPIRVTICNCHDCQRRTGSVFGVQARYATDAVKILGEFNTFTRTGDEGYTLKFNFCPNCGSTVFYTFDDSGEFVGITVGSFQDAEFPMPSNSIYGTRKHHWVDFPEGVTEHD